MKNLSFLAVFLLTSLSVFSQALHENEILSNPFLKSEVLDNQEFIRADSIISFQFISATDSFIFQKQYNRYDEQTGKGEYESWSWNAYNQTWGRYLSTNIRNGNSEILTFYNWNNDSNKYFPSGKSESIDTELFQEYTYYSYNSAANIFFEQSKSERWTNINSDDSIYIESRRKENIGEMAYDRMITYVYDTLQHLIQENTFVYNNYTWELKAKMEFGYDTLGNQIRRDNYMYLDFYGGLTNTARYHFTYDSLGNIVNSKTLTFSNNQWVNANQQSWVFDEQNRQVFSLQQKWDALNNQWLNEYKTEYNYEEVELKSNLAMGLSTKRSMFQWIPGQEWIPLSELVTITNESGLYGETSEKQFDVNTQTWQNYYQYQYIWDLENLVQLFQSLSTKNSDAEDWNIASKTYYYYDGINVFQSINAPQLSEYLIYPNPAKYNINIAQNNQRELAVQIFNLNGQNVFNSTYNQTLIQINIAHLPGGQYILNLRDRKSVVSQKIVKVD